MTGTQLHTLTEREREREREEEEEKEEKEKRIFFLSKDLSIMKKRK
jgi:hypothetical protein